MGRRELRLLAALLWSRSATCLLPRPLPPTRSSRRPFWSLIRSGEMTPGEHVNGSCRLPISSPISGRRGRGRNGRDYGANRRGHGGWTSPLTRRRAGVFRSAPTRWRPEPPPLTASTRLHDSKLLNATERRSLWLRLRGSSRIVWATGAATARRVDDVGVSAGERRGDGHRRGPPVAEARGAGNHCQ